MQLKCCDYNRAWWLALGFVLIACQFLPTGTQANPANPVSTVRSSSIQKQAKRPATTSYKVPEWWRKEWTRRQNVKRIEDRIRVQEMRESSKAMWNPRSPQAIAYRRAYLLSHKDLLPQTAAAASVRTAPQQAANPSRSAINSASASAGRLPTNHH